MYRSDAATFLVPKRNLGSPADVAVMNWGKGLAQHSTRRWGQKEGTQFLLESWILGSHKGRGLGFSPVLHLASLKEDTVIYVMMLWLQMLCYCGSRWPPLSKLWSWELSVSSPTRNEAGLSLNITCIWCGLSKCLHPTQCHFHWFRWLALKKGKTFLVLHYQQIQCTLRDSVVLWVLATQSWVQEHQYLGRQDLQVTSVHIWIWETLLTKPSPFQVRVRPRKSMKLF